MHSTYVESPPPPQRVPTSIHTQGEPCSELGRVLVLNDPPARVDKYAGGARGVVFVAWPGT
jgi:hypothetical protein